MPSELSFSLYSSQESLACPGSPSLGRPQHPTGDSILPSLNWLGLPARAWMLPQVPGLPGASGGGGAGFAPESLGPGVSQRDVRAVGSPGTGAGECAALSVEVSSFVPCDYFGLNLSQCLSPSLTAVSSVPAKQETRARNEPRTSVM